MCQEFPSRGDTGSSCYMALTGEDSLVEAVEKQLQQLLVEVVGAVEEHIQQILVEAVAIPRLVVSVGTMAEVAELVTSNCWKSLLVMALPSLPCAAIQSSASWERLILLALQLHASASSIQLS